jgi:UDP-2,3-diacylglucosamine pyrophosphatase LpxH
MNKAIFVVGDIHGKWDALFLKIKAGDIRDFVLIGVGDLGVGFKLEKQQARQFEYINTFFKSRNIDFLGIRGNHDDPAYFDGKISMSNFKLLPDYTSMTLDDKEFLFVGGAVSVDRRMRAQGISYWADEKFVLDVSKIKRCDVLITHSAPTWSGPFDKSGISGWCDRDSTLWDECVQERKDHDILLKLCGASRHYCGHFHTSSSVDFDGCVSTILDELEIGEIR